MYKDRKIALKENGNAVLTFPFSFTEHGAIYRREAEKGMLTPGNVVKVYKKEVLNNLVGGWNKVGFLSCKIYMEKELGRMKKELTTYDRGKCRKLFFL